jgi:hypothetical protein
MRFSKALWSIGSLIGAQQAVKLARRVEFDDVLGVLGMQRRRSVADLILPTIGLISLGAVVGASTALLMAPSSGAKLRQRLAEHAEKFTDKLHELQHSPANLTQQSQA